MIFDYNVIWEALPLYFGGLLVTLKLLALSLFFGLLAALPLGLMRVSKNAVVNMSAWLFTYVIRGTPMLVQLFLIYYGLAQFEAVRESFMWPWLSSATFLRAWLSRSTPAPTPLKSSPAACALRRTVRSKRPRPWACRATKCTSASCCRRPCAGRCRSTATK